MYAYQKPYLNKEWTVMISYGHFRCGKTKVKLARIFTCRHVQLSLKNPVGGVECVDLPRCEIPEAFQCSNSQLLRNRDFLDVETDDKRSESEVLFHVRK